MPAEKQAGELQCAIESDVQCTNVGTHWPILANCPVWLWVRTATRRPTFGQLHAMAVASRAALADTLMHC